MKNLIVVLIVTLMCVPSVFGIATADSTTWEGYYEADAFPHDVSAVPATSSGEIFLWSDDGGAASVGDGLLSINTIGMNEVAVWSGAGGGLSPSLDFVTGSSFEIRFRINAVDGDGGAMQLRFSDSAGNRLKGEISPGSYGFYVAGEGTVSSIPGLTPTSADSSWHILRFTMNGLGHGGLTTYLDNNPVPESVVWLGNTGIANELTFGDATGGNDADWDIDYMRWTGEGAFAAPEPITLGLLGLGSLFVRRRHRK